ncbi:MAG TPA: NADP-dependent oxidoreductase [Euzebyales bacterium]|nr:NADP-dependent oxidoreductase [Euzebyales bacterium]
MQAVVVQGPDQEPVIADVPEPQVSAGHVLVRVQAAGLNAIDNAIASGMMRGMMEHDDPVVLGRDAAGVVEAVGEQVTDVTVGDAVVGHVLLIPPIKHGTLAEYAVLPAQTLVPLPDGLDPLMAAAIPLAGAAAVACVEAVGPQHGEAVLIAGASGGVGSYAVQLAARRGATVIATGLLEDANRLRRLGADHVVDYRDDVAQQVRAAHPHGVDALIDLVSFTPDALVAHTALLRDGGRVATTTGSADPDALAARDITGTNIMATPVADVVGPLVQQAVDGSLTVDVGRVLDLPDAIEGLRTFASGHTRGNMVVRIVEAPK